MVRSSHRYSPGLPTRCGITDVARNQPRRPAALCTSDYGVLMRWYTRPEGDCAWLNLAPQLDSWDRADNRSQVELGKFLDEADTLLAASRIDGPWAAARRRLGAEPRPAGQAGPRQLREASRFPAVRRRAGVGLVHQAQRWALRPEDRGSTRGARAIDRCLSRYDNRLMGRTRGEGAASLVSRRSRMDLSDLNLPSPSVRAEIGSTFGSRLSTRWVPYSAMNIPFARGTPATAGSPSWACTSTSIRVYGTESSSASQLDPAVASRGAPGTVCGSCPV